MTQAETILTERIAELEAALKPLADIADEYDKDGLDEARPDRFTLGLVPYTPHIELYAGRGGKTLLTLEHVLHARDTLTRKKTPRPQSDALITRIKALYDASIPNLPWNSMSEERRQDVIKRYSELLRSL
jgi:hypothetical protein